MDRADRDPPLVPRLDPGRLLLQAARGVFPPADGGFSRARPWRPGVEGALAFTGHAVMVVQDTVTDAELTGLGVHGYGGAHHPRVALALAGDGELGVLDVLLVGRGTGTGGALVPRPDLAGTERGRHAGLWREAVGVYGLPEASVTSLATLARGIGGLPEVGIQAEGGYAQPLLDGIRARVPRGQVLLASVTPGNARSLRFFLRHGFVPVASVQLWQPRRTGAGQASRSRTSGATLLP